MSPLSNHISSRKPAMRIEIIQNGSVLRQHNHQGRSYIEAPPEGDYTIRLTNTSRRRRDGRTARQLAVVSVDGLNIVTGESAGFSGPGYVVGPGQTINIPGWRRTDSEVAAFQFKSQDKSYTAAMGNGTSNTGVIGLAVFEEKKPVRRPSSMTIRTSTTTTTTKTVNERINDRARLQGLGATGRSPSSQGLARGGMGNMDLGREIDDEWDDGHEGSIRSSTNDGFSAAVASAAYSADDFDYEPESASVKSTRRITRGRKSTPTLGTGYGSAQSMHTAETTFDRETQVPAAVVTLQYAVRAKLLEWGVPLPAAPPTPSAFPASSASVQAPPGWGG